MPEVREDAQHTRGKHFPPVLTTTAGAELRSLVALAFPVMVAQLSQMLIYFADTVMAGRVGSLDLAGVSIGSSLCGSWFLFVIGTLMAVSPSVAQLRGAKKHEQIGPLVHQAFWLAIVLGLLSFALLRNARTLLVWIDVAPEIVPVAVAYLKAYSWGVPAFALFLVLRYFYEALSHPRMVMIVLLLGLLLNVVGNYAFIYGKFGFPALGGVGCGWASSVATWFMFVCMAGISRRRIYRTTYLWSRPRLDWAVLGELLKLGLPIGVGLFIEGSIFSVIALFISGLGADVVSAHQIALNFASLIFMIPLSIGMATTIRVGEAVGRGRFSQSRLAAYIGIGLAAATAVVTSVFILLFPRPIAAIYSDENAVLSLAAHLLLFAAVFQISDAVQVSTLGALRGYKDTRIPMIITVISYWIIGLPIGYVLGLTSYWNGPMGARGFWIGLVAGLSAAAFLLSWRLWRVSPGKLNTLD